MSCTEQRRHTSPKCTSCVQTRVGKTAQRSESLSNRPQTTTYINCYERPKSRVVVRYAAHTTFPSFQHHRLGTCQYPLNTSNCAHTNQTARETSAAAIQSSDEQPCLNTTCSKKKSCYNARTTRSNVQRQNRQSSEHRKSSSTP